MPAKRKGSAGLTSGQARRFYDWFGRAQDLQAFYEDRAVGDLLAHGRFDAAGAVLEAGCGTGWLAARLLDGTLPADSRYLGADISGTMTALAWARLRAFGGRARAIRADVSRPLPVAAGMVDRFVAVYLLDLLAPGDAAVLLAEARRVLRPGGLLCTASLTPGPGHPAGLRGVGGGLVTGAVADRRLPARHRGTSAGWLAHPTPRPDQRLGSHLRGRHRRQTVDRRGGVSRTPCPWSAGPGWSTGTAIGTGTAPAAASYHVRLPAPVVSWVRPGRHASLLYWSAGNDQVT